MKLFEVVESYARPAFVVVQSFFAMFERDLCLKTGYSPSKPGRIYSCELLSNSSCSSLKPHSQKNARRKSRVNRQNGILQLCESCFRDNRICSSGEKSSTIGETTNETTYAEKIAHSNFERFHFN